MTKNFKMVTIIVFGLIIISALSVRVLKEINSPPLPILGTVPDFSLTDSRGDVTSLKDFHGKVWVADFIFTTCAGPCPVMTGHMYLVHKDTKENDDVRLVSISVNPDYDTPEILTEYASRYHADTNKWKFLTGSIEDIQRIIVDGFKIGDPDEIVFHSTKFALVDRKGRIRGYYNGTDEKEVKKMNADMERLLKEI